MTRQLSARYVKKTMLGDHEDARGIIRRQGDKLDDAYIVDWLVKFEEALDDSTLLSMYRRLWKRSG